MIGPFDTPLARGLMARDDDDDGDDEDPAPPDGPSTKERIFVAVAVAGLSAIVTGFAEWGIEKLRERFDGKKGGE